jgi:hypothetical protein
MSNREVHRDREINERAAGQREGRGQMDIVRQQAIGGERGEHPRNEQNEQYLVQRVQQTHAAYLRTPEHQVYERVNDELNQVRRDLVSRPDDTRLQERERLVHQRWHLESRRAMETPQYQAWEEAERAHEEYVDNMRENPDARRNREIHSANILMEYDELGISESDGARMAMLNDMTHSLNGREGNIGSAREGQTAAERIQEVRAMIARLDRRLQERQSQG